MAAITRDSLSFDSSLMSLATAWVRDNVNAPDGQRLEAISPTGTIVLVVMARDRVTHGEEISAGVRTRLSLNKDWDAEIVAVHGLKRLLKAGYVRLAEPGTELKNLDDFRQRWELTAAGKSWLRDASLSGD